MAREFLPVLWNLHGRNLNVGSLCPRCANTLHQNTFEKGLFLCWAIWVSRNDVKNNGKNTPVSTSTFALQCFEQFRLAQQHEEMSDMEMTRKWGRPKQGYVKVNFDGAFKEADGMGEIMEALAALDALIFAEDMDVQKITVEGDVVE
ncbi:hypothetical protein REPUB_Repub12eG0143300 [Reevesia pubescens]